MLPHLPPELQLACLLCRRVLSDALCQSARDLVGRGLDWDWFLDVASEHRILPLVSRHLAERLAEMVPARVRSEIGAYVLANSKRAEAMADELAAIASARLLLART